MPAPSLDARPSPPLSPAQERLGDFTRDHRLILLSLMALLVGVASTLVARALLWLIGLITSLAYYQRLSATLVSPAHNRLGLLAVVVPVVGGLIVGLMARYGSEKVRGHGIPEALEAILIGKSRMEPKVAVLKPLSSAIAIGTGGPFGAEGPIIVTGGAVGSVFAQLFALSASERKTLLAAGAAAGMAAIFATPIAAVLLALELLLFEWKPRSFVPVAVAVAVAATLRPLFFGAGPMFPTNAVAAPSALVLGIAIVLGIIAGLFATLLTTLLYGCEDLFRRLPLHWALWPALGGLVVGLGGLAEPRVLGVGYDLIGELLNSRLLGLLAVGLLAAKAAVWLVALSSGTSGGVLAPLLIIGGCLGALVAPAVPMAAPVVWVAVGMAAVMGASMGAPLTAVVFVTELTGALTLVPTLVAATFAAVGVSVLVLRRSMLTEKVARRGHHLTREFVSDPLAHVCVAEVMDASPPVVAADATVTDLSDRLAAGDRALTRHHGWPVVDDEGRLVGIITRNDLVRALARDAASTLTVLEAGSTGAIVAFVDEPVHVAVTRLLQHNIGRLPVVRRDDPTRVVGYFGRTAVLRARQVWLEAETVRERTWLWRSALRDDRQRGLTRERGPRHEEKEQPPA